MYEMFAIVSNQFAIIILFADFSGFNIALSHIKHHFVSKLYSKYLFATKYLKVG